VQNKKTSHTLQSLSRNVLVCFSHLRWDFVYQRPQHLLSRAARDYQVLFVEEPVFEDATTPRLVQKQDKSGVWIVVPHLPHRVRELQNEILEGLIAQLLSTIPTRNLYLWYYTPLALSFTRKLACDARIYDNMDELSGFLGASVDILQMEEEMFQKAVIVFTGGQSLFDAKRHRHNNIYAFPSSIDAAHFRQARSLRADSASRKRPQIGFFGVIDERMNIALVRELASLRPAWDINMLGPIAKIDPDSLPRATNIHWLGMKSYDDLPAHLAQWDIGIMPFAINASTKYISPTKTPEFLAAGLPVVSTVIHDVVHPYGDMGLVEIADTASAFVDACERLLHRPGEQWLTKVDRFLAQNSWDKTWNGMEKLMLQAARSVSTETVARAKSYV